MMQRCALVMAGGTGGHIFPGLAVAEALRDKGWQVHWLGGKGSADNPSMESQLVPARGSAFETIVRNFRAPNSFPPRPMRPLWL